MVRFSSSRTLRISIETNWIQRSSQKNAGGGERRVELLQEGNDLLLK